MEITLNLLPPYLIQQRELQRRKRARGLIAAAAVLPVLLAYVLLNARIHTLRVRAESLDRQVVALTPAAGQARQLETDLAALRQREDALSRLAVRFPRWSGVLVRLSSLVPRDIWLTSLSITGNQFTMVGQSLNENAVSILTARLASAQFLTGSSVKFVRESTAGARRVYGFEIGGTLRPEGHTP